MAGLATACLAPIFALAEAAASPPFVLDDGDVLDPGHVEVDVGTLATTAGPDASGDLLSVEADVGAVPGIETDIVVPLAYARTTGAGFRSGPGDLDLALKARLLEQSASSAKPSLAVEPTLTVPTGDAGRGLGSGDAELFLPLWISKDVGAWNAFGGGGTTVGLGAARRADVVLGAGLAARVSVGWHLGGEAYATSRAGPGEAGTVSIDLDAVGDLSRSTHLFLSFGGTFATGAAATQASVFAGVQFTR